MKEWSGLKCQCVLASLRVQRALENFFSFQMHRCVAAFQVGKEKKKTSEVERLYFDASEEPALTFSLHSLSWFFRVMQLEACLICSQRFLPFLHTKEHINLTGSTDISLQHLDFPELHQLPCQIVLPHPKPGQQEWGSKQRTAHC